ncbi:MAG: hypothetical protein GY804_09885 [Alphaproteobacteria bacterium]|nr:hypothetical protein [Alphaproteobacteria bacterium]
MKKDYLSNATKQAIRESKEYFLMLVKEIGYKKAKEIVLKETILKEVINFIKAYK